MKDVPLVKDNWSSMSKHLLSSCPSISSEVHSNVAQTREYLLSSRRKQGDDAARPDAYANPFDKGSVFEAVRPTLREPKSRKRKMEEMVPGRYAPARVFAEHEGDVLRRLSGKQERKALRAEHERRKRANRRTRLATQGTTSGDDSSSSNSSGSERDEAPQDLEEEEQDASDDNQLGREARQRRKDRPTKGTDAANLNEQRGGHDVLDHRQSCDEGLLSMTEAEVAAEEAVVPEGQSPTERSGDIVPAFI